MATNTEKAAGQGAQLTRLVGVLKDASQHLPSNLPKAWFSESLFHCRSEKPLDYLAEIESNLCKLAQMSQEAPGYAYLSEHTQAQLVAYTQAIYRAKKPSAKGAAAQAQQNAESSSRRAKLEHDLARHLEYERRLQDNLRQAQATQLSGQPHNAAHTNNQALVLKCQQRLLRCQRAIADLEKRLECLT